MSTARWPPRPRRSARRTSRTWRTIWRLGPRRRRADWPCRRPVQWVCSRSPAACTQGWSANPEHGAARRKRMRTEHPSVCPLDCPDTCSLTVTVEDEKIVSIRGSRANPYTAGVLCAKVPEAYPGFVHGEGRIKTPLRRTGAKGEGRFERITWSQALDIVHERFTAVIAAHGPQAILPLNYAGPHGMLAGGSMDLRFFHRLGASLLDRRPLCGGIRTEAWVGTFGPTPGVRPEQAEHSKLIVACGRH